MNRPTIQELMENKLGSLDKSRQDLVNSDVLENLALKIQDELSLTDIETDGVLIEIVYVLFEITPLDQFKLKIEEIVGKGGKTAQLITNMSQEEIFSKLKNDSNKKSDSLNHQDILSEIENPTPSIASREPAPQIEVKALVEEIKKPTLEQALNGVLPTEGGFSFNENSHPAESIVKKLDEKLSTPTSSLPKEVYVVKKIDPYHEPIE